MNRITLSIIFLGIIIAHACSAAESLPMSGQFEEKWVVTKILGFGDTSGGMPEAKQLIGKELEITANKMEFDKDTCLPNDDFKINRIDTPSVFNTYYGFSSSDAGLPPKTLLLDSKNCAPIFLKDKSQIVFGWDGLILQAKRKTPDRGR